MSGVRCGRVAAVLVAAGTAALGSVAVPSVALPGVALPGAALPGAAVPSAAAALRSGSGSGSASVGVPAGSARGPLASMRRPLPPLPSPPVGGGVVRPGAPAPSIGVLATEPADPCADRVPRVADGSGGLTGPTGPTGPANPAGSAGPARGAVDASACCREYLRTRLPGTAPAALDCRDDRLDPGRGHAPIPGAHTGPIAASAAPAPASARSEADPSGDIPPGRPPGRPAGGRGVAPYAKPPRRARPPGTGAGGDVAKRAVHDGPAVLARRAITDQMAGTGSGAVLPLGLAAGALLLVGGVLLAVTHRRTPRPPGPPRPPRAPGRHRRTE